MTEIYDWVHSASCQVLLVMLSKGRCLIDLDCHNGYVLPLILRCSLRVCIPVASIADKPDKFRLVQRIGRILLFSKN